MLARRELLPKENWIYHSLNQSWNTYTQFNDDQHYQFAFFVAMHKTELRLKQIRREKEITDFWKTNTNKLDK